MSFLFINLTMKGLLRSESEILPQNKAKKSICFQNLRIVKAPYK